jgi:hypothetical protein
LEEIMKRLPLVILALAITASSLILTSTCQAVIINIDAIKYGCTPTDPIPQPGDIITPVTNPAGQPLLTLTLPAGTYSITNATGMVGANPNFNAWRFNGTGWTWSFMITDDATKKVIIYGALSPPVFNYDRAAAANEAMGYYAEISLPTTTTLDFMMRDYGLTDNVGGVALSINAVNAVPVPGAVWLLGSGLLGLGALRRFRSS